MMKITRSRRQSRNGLGMYALILTALLFWGSDAFSQLKVPCCQENLLRNPGFEMGALAGSGTFQGCATTGTNYVNNWCAVGSPQYNSSLGIGGNRGILMWGIGANFNTGEGIYQAVNIATGWMYQISFDALFYDAVSTGPDSVIFQFRAFNSAPTSPLPAGGALIGEYVVKNTSYGRFTLPVWTPNSAYSYLQIRVRNGSTTNDGAYVSWGRIDNVCLERELIMGIDDKNPEEAAYTLYPNPNSGQISLSFPPEAGDLQMVKVTDLTGRTFEVPVLSAGMGEAQFDTSHLLTGTYTLSVTFSDPNYRTTLKFEKF
ncbi:MAG TPA: T9SS type A sorting domain-containing protein [Bacteroidetes bacterium]|nr:T9SS type A sorting domain-containing protein [Bacteroidota bacterium]